MDKEQKELIRLLLGQTTALTTIVFALIDTHPNKAALALHLAELKEWHISGHLNLPVSEQFSDEFQKHLELFLKRVQSS